MPPERKSPGRANVQGHDRGRIDQVLYTLNTVSSASETAMQLCGWSRALDLSLKLKSFPLVIAAVRHRQLSALITIYPECERRAAR